ncbi:MAG TPA: TIGR03546 family protein [Gemmatimonadales bacterium]
MKFIQSLFNTLHSEGTPGQVAAGLALGAFFGLTPLLSVHTLVIFALLCLLNVSFGGAMLGWAIFTPFGFLLDPVFDAVGRRLLLETPALTPLWTTLANTPVVPLTNFNNSVVLGSVVCSTMAFLPLWFAGCWGVERYRVTLGPKVTSSRLYRAIAASKLYNAYRFFFGGK